MRKNSFMHCKLLSSQLTGRFGFNTNHLPTYSRIAYYNKMVIDPWTRNFSSKKSICNYDFVFDKLRTHGSKQIFGNSVSSVAVNARQRKDEGQKKWQKQINFATKIQKSAEMNDIATCLKLYEEMLKQKIEPLDTVESLIFAAIGNSSDRQNGIEALHKLQSLLNDYNVNLNYMNYVSALQTCHRLHYGNKGLIFYDEMNRKGIRSRQTWLDVYQHVLECVFFSNENTLETNLIFWHTMLESDCTPNLTTFKILLSNLAFARCNITKLEGYLSRRFDRIEIRVQEDGETNLLAKPPVLSKSSLSTFKNEKGDISLKDIFKKDKLFLLGGCNNILRMIKMYGYTPDEVLITHLLRLLPDSIFLEDEFINQAAKMQIPLTDHFFNSLIEKRCFRFDYQAANDVLALMEAENVKPNDSTWEALAYTCHHYADIEKFLYHIGQHEKTPSDKTLRRLIKNIGHTKSHYKLYNLCHLMKYISENKLKPSEKTIQVLDSIVEQCEELKNKKADKLASNIQLINYGKFLNFYHDWRCNYQHNVKES